MMTEERPAQPLKAMVPMVVTELGMVIEVKPLQPSKAPELTDTTPFFIATEVLLGISPLYLYATFSI